MNIISIDLGKNMGIAVGTESGIQIIEDYKFVGYNKFFNKVAETVDLWNADLILIPYPTRFYRVIMAHAKLMGIVELIADRRSIQVIEVQDKTCKKLVIGKGNAAKEDIKEYYKEEFPAVESEHILDAVMFYQWYLKSI